MQIYSWEKGEVTYGGVGGGGGVCCSLYQCVSKLRNSCRTCLWLENARVPCHVAKSSVENKIHSQAKADWHLVADRKYPLLYKGPHCTDKTGK